MVMLLFLFFVCIEGRYVHIYEVENLIVYEILILNSKVVYELRILRWNKKLGVKLKESNDQI